MRTFYQPRELRASAVKILLRPTRLHSTILFGLALLVLLSLPVFVVATGGVFSLTKHGDPTTGAQRDTALPRGDCAQCHVSHSGQPFALFAANTNGLCYTSGCHNLAGALTIYQGPSVYDNSSHATKTSMLWPGFDASLDSSAPRARPSGDWGKCVNCHAPHGYNRDGTGLIPSLVFSREEKLCLVCHDGSPAVKDIKSQLSKRSKHPVTLSGKHSVNEDGNSAAYGASPTDNRHAECVDCHNPHAAKTGTPFPATASYLLTSVGRIAVTNGGAGSVPTYRYLAPNDTSAPNAEYQLCFKCHSSWTTQPLNAKNLAVEFNPNNESFHPVEGPGRNTTPKMLTNLGAGTGLPHLSTSDTIWCSDCHNNDDMPTTVSTLSGYSGFAPRGPHGSNVGTDTNMSGKILRANYRVKLMPINTAYSASNFTLCLICHASAPFTDKSGNNRSDSNFRFHGYHLSNINNNPGSGVAGDIDTPGNGTAGQGNAICKECHYTLHSTKLTYHLTNRSYGRLVNFAPSISGSGGTGSPSWNQTTKTCNLKCHGKSHSNYTY